MSSYYVRSTQGIFFFFQYTRISHFRNWSTIQCYTSHMHKCNLYSDFFQTVELLTDILQGEKNLLAPRFEPATFCLSLVLLTAIPIHTVVGLLLSHLLVQGPFLSLVEWCPLMLRPISPTHQRTGYIDHCTFPKASWTQLPHQISLLIFSSSWTFKNNLFSLLQ